jgi:hypothetical protein
MQDISFFLILSITSVALVLLAIFSRRFRANKRKKILVELSNRRSDINQAHEELNGLLNSNSYMERRTIDLWVKRWVFLFPVLKALKKHKIVDPALDEKIVMLFRMFEKTHETIAERNEAFIEQEGKRFEWLFNSVEKYPLKKNHVLKGSFERAMADPVLLLNHPLQSLHLYRWQKPLQPRLTTFLLPQYTQVTPPVHLASLSASAHSASEGMKDSIDIAINIDI